MKVREMWEKFNDREINYKYLIATYDVSRDLILRRFKEIGILYDNTEKIIKPINEYPSEDILNMDCAILFERRKAKDGKSASKSKSKSNSTFKGKANSNINIKHDSNNNSIGKSNNESTHNSNEETEQAINESDLSYLLKAKGKKDSKYYRGFYLSPEVVKALDKIPKGNKSELVDELLKHFLKEKGLL